MWAVANYASMSPVLCCFWHIVGPPRVLNVPISRMVEEGCLQGRITAPGETCLGITIFLPG